MNNNAGRNNELKHYGVLGMKWGVRRARRKIMNKKISQLSAEERDGRYTFVKDLLKE